MIERFDTGIYLTYLRDVFGSLNMLLEHKDRTIGSGNDTIRAKATAKLSFTTNPYKQKKTIGEHVEMMGTTTFSRMLGLVIDMEERELIHEKETKTNKNEMMTKEEFLTIFDSCQEFLSKYEEEKVRKIYQKSLDLTKGSMREVWKARGLHHSILILDGLVKYRCLFEEDSHISSLKIKKMSLFLYMPLCAEKSSFPRHGKIDNLQISLYSVYTFFLDPACALLNLLFLNS